MSCETTKTRRQSHSRNRVSSHFKRARVLTRQPVHRKVKLARRKVNKSLRRSVTPHVKFQTGHKSAASKKASAHARATARAHAHATASAHAKARARATARAHARATARASAHASASRTARAHARRGFHAHAKACTAHKRNTVTKPRKTPRSNAKTITATRATKATRASKGLRALRELQTLQARIASYGP